MAFWPWLSHSHACVLFTRTSVSPKETGSAILSLPGPPYQIWIGMGAGDQRSRRHRRGRHSADIRQGGEAEVRALRHGRDHRGRRLRLVHRYQQLGGRLASAVPGRLRSPVPFRRARAPTATRAPPGSAHRGLEPERASLSHRATSTGSWAIRTGCPARKHTQRQRTTGGHRLWCAATGSPRPFMHARTGCLGRELDRGRA